MGYDIHITRRQSWSDEGEPAITLQEWRDIIANDPELEPVGDDQAAMCAPDRGGARAFGYLEGNISVKKPNRPVLMKMLAIAEKLRARVIGDDDEVYSHEGIPDKPASFTIAEGW